MYWIVGVVALSVLFFIGLGVYLEIRPRRTPAPWWRKAVVVNLFTFVVAQLTLLVLGTGEALAQEAATGAAQNTLGLGLAILGAGLPTAFSTIGAGIAIGPVGSAAMAAIAERPETFGRTLVYLGLAEGIAIYGLVMSILLWAKI